MSVLPRMLEAAGSAVEFEGIDGMTMLGLRPFGLSRSSRLIKRGFDIAVSVLLLAFSMPALALTALMVRLESRGPVFYRQERVGLNGRPFMLLKFRSMRVDAEKDAGPQWAAVSDPRITTVGRFIRQTRIDEIPQVFNVLGGSMSFIGPRPERPYFVEKLCEKIPYYSERHRVKPGITGWAQVNGHRGETPTIEAMRARVDHDVWYVAHADIALDLKILFRTAFEVLRSRNAY